MRKLILVTGDLATGKSTFARSLSNRYHIHWLCKDSLKEVLGDTIGFTDRAENLKLSVASAALMRLIFSEFCLLDADLILESNFRQAELDLLYEMADKNGYEVLTMELRAYPEVLHARFLHRLHMENRHRVHACGGFEDFDTFRQYLESQRGLKVRGYHLRIDANNFDYQQDKNLLYCIDEFVAGRNTK